MPIQSTSQLGLPLNTTDATPAVAWTFPTLSGNVYQVIAKVQGVNIDDTDEGIAYYLRALFSNQGGTLAQIGSTQSIAAAIEHADLTAADAALSASGTNIIVTATGVAATNLTWTVSAEISVAERYISNGGFSPS